MKWINDNPIKHKKSTKKYYENTKIAALRHYSGGIPSCACCGELEKMFLVIDHMNGGGGQHRKAISGHISTWLKRQDYPDGYRVLCHNCNHAVRLGVCPHSFVRAVNG